MSRLLKRSTLVYGALVAFCVAGCGEAERVSRRGAAVAGGSAEGVNSVFLLRTDAGSSAALCSAVLVTPRLLLTAAHCVSGAVQAVECGVTTFPADPGSILFHATNVGDVTVAPSPSDRSFTAKPVYFPAGEPLCGSDWALLELDEAVPSEVATPATCSLSSELKVGLIVRAVGYGAGHSAGTGEGIRRASAWSPVQCVGAECSGFELVGAAGSGSVPFPDATGQEFGVNVGSCPGDSGGPIVDEAGVVRGITSRGSDDCGPSITTPITRAVADAVSELSEAHGVPVPEWAVRPVVSDSQGGASGGGSTSLGGTKGNEERSPVKGGGCSLAGGGASRNAAGGLSVLSGILAFVARRRKRVPTGLVALASLSSLGCTSVYVDTEERRFTELCEKKDCSLREGNAETADFRVDASSQVLTVCPKATDADYECRPLVCDSDRACNPSNVDGFACVDGICRNAQLKLRTKDVIAECLRGTGPWKGVAQQRERLTLARACGEKCGLPSQCRTKPKRN